MKAEYVKRKLNKIKIIPKKAMEIWLKDNSGTESDSLHIVTVDIVLSV